MSADTPPSPVYDGFASPPPTYPIGVPIADKVSVATIDQRTATRVYEAHHSYLDRGRCGWHYGVYLEDGLVGAITFDNWPSQSEIRGYESADIREVARVCVAHETPNLASCAMAKAQDTFVDQHGDEFDLLLTYVHGEYEGSMFKALRGKGWEFDGISEGRNRGPHHGESEIYDIYKTDKERWVCEIGGVST